MKFNRAKRRWKKNRLLKLMIFLKKQFLFPARFILFASTMLIFFITYVSTIILPNSTSPYMSNTISIIWHTKQKNIHTRTYARKTWIEKFEIFYWRRLHSKNHQGLQFRYFSVELRKTKRFFKILPKRGIRMLLSYLTEKYLLARYFLVAPVTLEKIYRRVTTNTRIISFLNLLKRKLNWHWIRYKILEEKVFCFFFLRDLDNIYL